MGEGSAKTKSDLGYNMPRNSDGTVNIDKAVQMKLAQTQSMVDAYNQYAESGSVGSAVAQLASGSVGSAVQDKVAPRDLMDGRVAAKCTSLLGGVASSGHSDTEVAAFCRAAYTPEMCGTLRASLGRLPWSAAKIQEACQHWDARVKADDRGMLSYDELHQALESSANQKAQLGYNMPRNSDGTVNIDGAVQMKLAQTQSMVDTYNQYMGHTTAPPSQFAARQTQGSDHEKAVPLSQEVSGLWTAGHGFVVAATEDTRLLVCGMFAIFAAATVLAARLRIAGSGRREVVSLLEDGEE